MWQGHQWAKSWGENVTKVSIIDQIDKFILEKEWKKEKTGKEGTKNLGGPPGNSHLHPLDAPMKWEMDFQHQFYHSYV